MGTEEQSSDRRQLPVVFCTPPKCPRCQGTNIQTRRSVRVEESSTRFVTCRACQHRFKIIME